MSYVIVEHYRIGGKIISVRGPYESEVEATNIERKLNANEMQHRPMLYYYTVKPLVKDLE